MHARRWRGTRAKPSARWATTRRAAVLSHKQRSLYDYFRQQFAQVTNPPIDPLRESIVMSLQTRDRPREQRVRADARARAADRPEFAGAVAAQAARRSLAMTDSASRTRSSTCSTTPEPRASSRRCIELCAEAEAAVRGGKLVLLLSDRYLEAGKLPMHALLATGAIHTISSGLGCAASATSSSRPAPRAIRTTSPA